MQNVFTIILFKNLRLLRNSWQVPTFDLEPALPFTKRCKWSQLLNHIPSWSDFLSTAHIKKINLYLIVWTSVSNGALKKNEKYRQVAGYKGIKNCNYFFCRCSLVPATWKILVYLHLEVRKTEIRKFKLNTIQRILLTFTVINKFVIHY